MTGRRAEMRGLRVSLKDLREGEKAVLRLGKIQEPKGG